MEAGLGRNRILRANRIRFLIIALIFVGMQMALLLLGWGAVRVIDATRAYASGESLYSKSEKQAIYALCRYAASSDERDYAIFRAAFEVPVGDNRARQAMERPVPDLAMATAGLLQGRNHPEDIDSLIRLFLWFRFWRPFTTAVEDWRASDALLAEISGYGETLRSGIAAGTLDLEKRLEISALIEAADGKFTGLEDRFSGHIGEAGREASRLVTIGLGCGSLILWGVGIGFAWRIFARCMNADRLLMIGQNRFKDFAETSSDWFWETDGELRLSFPPELSGHFSSDRPVHLPGGRLPEVLRPGIDEAQDAASLANVAAHRDFRGLRFLGAAQDGSEQCWLLSAKAIHDSAGQFVGYRGTASNVTAETRAKAVLEQAKARAELANQAKSDFLANVSHEVRTPLNAILGFAEIIRDQVFGPVAGLRYAEYAGDIHRSGLHLLALINDILDLSKIEAGHEELCEEDVEIRPMVDAVVLLLRQQADRAGVALEGRVAPDGMTVRGDERRLRQALINIVVNAIAFTPEAGRVTVSAGMAADGGLRIEVRDTGIGIAPEDMAKVFEPFGRIKNRAGPHRAGTGLGVPLSRHLIEIHGGTLTIESTPGQGTSAIITLPESRNHTVPTRPPAEAGFAKPRLPTGNSV